MSNSLAPVVEIGPSSSSSTLQTIFSPPTPLQSPEGTFTPTPVITPLVSTASMTPLSISDSGSNGKATGAPVSSGSNNSPNNTSNNIAVIVGSVVGGVVFLALVAALLVFLLRRRRPSATDDAAAKEMTDGPFAPRGPSYQHVPADASNDLLLRTQDPDLREKYAEYSNPQSPVTPLSSVPTPAPKPYTPQLHGPAETTPALTASTVGHKSSQLYYVPAIAGPGNASTVAPPSTDPYGDSKTQEDE